MNQNICDRLPRLATPLNKIIVFLLLFLGCLASAAPVQNSQPSAVLFENVRIFDGKSERLSEPANVLVRGNKIEKISDSPIPVDRSGATSIINGAGRTLMPGLIDAHWHTMFVRPPHAEMAAWDVGYANLV